ncbi:hypothetical protein GRAN_2331 [Granulicella sibirica]|uniref:Uncharacterized protein n=1 Tax=Granulicella sibirica TaxID=2479048 RepID=A0A4V1L5E4_9BACT|nr:hypothetical protein GRAN_2331 [Granulicella sibirica]
MFVDQALIVKPSNSLLMKRALDSNVQRERAVDKHACDRHPLHDEDAVIASFRFASAAALATRSQNLK